MPNFNSVKAAAATPSRSGIGAEILVDNVVLGTTHAALDTVTCLKLPKGFIVTSVGLAASGKPGATSGVYTIGDGTSAARWGTTAAITAASGVCYNALDNTPLAADTNLVLTLSALTGAAAAHNLFIQVYGTFNT